MATSTANRATDSRYRATGVYGLYVHADDGHIITIPDAVCDYCPAEPVGRTNGPDVPYCANPAHRAAAERDHAEVQG